MARMPEGNDRGLAPPATRVIDYLTAYERRYQIRWIGPVRVNPLFPARKA